VKDDKNYICEMCDQHREVYIPELMGLTEYCDCHELPVSEVENCLAWEEEK
jgi:hypothetical protein